MSWFPSSGSNNLLLSIYKNAIKDRVKTLKKAKRVKVFAEEVALLDPSKITPADIATISRMNLEWMLYGEESELVRKDIESFIHIWLSAKQDKSPFPSENLLEELL
mgnify:FL=1